MWNPTRRKYLPEGKARTTMGPACDTYNASLRKFEPGTKVRLRNTFTGKVLLKGAVPTKRKSSK